MKRMLALVLILLVAFSVVACGKDDDGDSKKDDKKNESSSKKDDKDSKGDSNGDGVIEKFIGDKVTLPKGGQAHDSWHALTTYRTYEFSKDGKCTKSEDIYYIDDPANYELANDRLTSSNFIPEWSADKTYFSLNNEFISYTKTEDAIEYYESKYYPYTIQYSNGSEKHVDEPDTAAKLANITSVYGITFDDVKGMLGKYTIATWQREALSIRMGENSTMDDMNALCAKLYEVCKPLAEDGKMYTYLGKYGEELTAAPQVTSEFDSAEFHYFKDGKEIKVSVGISQKLNKVLTLFIGVVK